MNLDLPDIYNAATTFVDENIAQGRGGKIAIYYQDQTITYQEVFEKVNRAGNAFKDLGIEIENRVLVILPDSPEFAYSFFGAIKIGAVAIPTNPWMFAKDYEYLINDSRARAIVVHESTLPEVEKIWDRTPFLKHVIVVGKPKGKALLSRVWLPERRTSSKPPRPLETTSVSGVIPRAARAIRKARFICSTI